MDEDVDREAEKEMASMYGQPTGNAEGMLSKGETPEGAAEEMTGEE